MFFVLLFVCMDSYLYCELQCFFLQKNKKCRKIYLQACCIQLAKRACPLGYLKKRLESVLEETLRVIDCALGVLDCKEVLCLSNNG